MTKWGHFCNVFVIDIFVIDKCRNCPGIFVPKFSRKNRYFSKIIYVNMFTKFFSPLTANVCYNRIVCTNWIRHLILWTPKISETGISQILYFQKMVLKNDSLIQQEYFKRTILSSLIWLSHVSKILKYYFVISHNLSQ